MKTTEQIQSELDALQAELKEINARRVEIDVLRKQLDFEEKELMLRKQVISGKQQWNYSTSGLIGYLGRQLIELKSPIYENIDANGCYSGRITRIISVDKKWIELKCDGQSLDSSTKYSRETGWRMRSRDNDGAIDAQKALVIWNEFNGEKS